jgi:hypothetical protein
MANRLLSCKGLLLKFAEQLKLLSSVLSAMSTYSTS